jgi:hypothetical protein
MREILLASGIAFGVAVGQLLLRALSGQGLLGAGFGAIVTGLFISVPAAIMYHLRLHSALHRRGELDAHWIWHPTRLHPKLRPNERLKVLPWFAIGVAGWLLALVGCGLALVAVFH